MIKGFTYGWDARRGMFKTEESFESMKRLAETGCNWVTLAFMVTQQTFSSTRFGFDYRFCVTDREIILAVERLKSLGMKVCLKPILNSEDGVWRAHISFPDIEFPVTDNSGNERHFHGKRNKYWDEWFSCYTAFICHYAEIAEDTNCEMLCLGCEMLGTEKKEDYWRLLIDEVKNIYHGKTVYNTNHGSENNVKWFDAVDFIGTSAYYPVADGGGESAESMVKRWEKVKPQLAAVSEKFGGKKIVFMEIGCRSARGCAAMPWDFNHVDLPYDEDEQNNFYLSALTAFWDEPWFGGFFWWDWGTNLYPIEKSRTDRGFAIYGKKAEKTLSEWYHSH